MKFASFIAASALLLSACVHIGLQSINTGGQPTAEQLEAAARAGFRTIVNLRTPGEEGSWEEAPKAADRACPVHRRRGS